MSEVRNQRGSFHVYFRGNNRSTVFYEKNDFINSLIALELAAKEHNTKINAFVLMTNHVHLHVTTNCLTRFMRSLMLRYVKKYNHIKGTSGKLFSTPFNSIPTNSGVTAFHTILYILKNPINAGICKSLADYPWSSYHFHNKKSFNNLFSIITINTTIVDSYVKSIECLDKEISNFKPEVTKDKSIRWPKMSDYEIAQHFVNILNGRMLSSLTSQELINIILLLNSVYSATSIQIASILHMNLSEVKIILLKYKYKKRS